MFCCASNLNPFSNIGRIALALTIPFTNDINESIQFFIKGISVSLLLGDRHLNKILTFCYLVYLIFNTIKSLHATFCLQDQIPQELTMIKTCFAIGALNSVKKVLFSTQQSTQQQSRNTTQQPQCCANDLPPRPTLGIVITKTSPIASLLFNAIHFV